LPISASFSFSDGTENFGQWLHAVNIKQNADNHRKIRVLFLKIIWPPTMKKSDVKEKI